MMACGLNPVDAKITGWKEMVPDMDANWTPGLDVSGEIVALGAGVSESLAFEGEMVELVDVVRPQEYRDVFSRALSFHQLALGAGHRAGAEAEKRIVQAGLACCGG